MIPAKLTVIFLVGCDAGGVVPVVVGKSTTTEFGTRTAMYTTLVDLVPAHVVNVRNPTFEIHGRVQIFQFQRIQKIVVLLVFLVDIVAIVVLLAIVVTITRLFYCDFLTLKQHRQCVVGNVDTCSKNRV